MEIPLRRAGPADGAAIAELFREADLLHHRGVPAVFGVPTEPVRPAGFLEAILVDPDQELLVVEDAGSVLGFVHALLRPRRPPFVAERIAVIESIVVAERAQGRGLGRRLMLAAHDWARERGATEAWINVWAFNERAIAFYDALGYETACHLMRLPLDA